MDSKLNTVLSMFAVIGLIVLCVIAGAKLEQKINLAETQETFKTSESNPVVIDAGHGGADAGKTGVNGEEEKNINLKISEKIKKLLSDNEIPVRMTRESDGRLAESQREDLKARTDIMNSGALLAVSIHQNSYHDPSVWGGQVFYHTESEEGRKAAEMIQSELNSLSPDHEKKIKSNDTYYILKNTQVPAVIVECGFMSNYAEAEKLSSDEYQGEIAEAVTRGILHYIND